MTSPFPDELKIFSVVAVHKAGDKEDSNNYRPIAVLPTLARVLFMENCTTILPKIIYWAINSLVLDHYIQLLLLLVNQWIIG